MEEEEGRDQEDWETAKSLGNRSVGQRDDRQRLFRVGRTEIVSNLHGLRRSRTIRGMDNQAIKIDWSHGSRWIGSVVGKLRVDASCVPLSIVVIANARGWISLSLSSSLPRIRARTHTNLHTDRHLVSYSCPFVRYICQASSVTYGSANTRRLINSVHDGGIAAQLTPYPPGITLYDIRLDFAEIGLVPEHYADTLAGPEPAQRQTTSLYLAGYGGRILSIVLKKIDTILREAFESIPQFLVHRRSVSQKWIFFVVKSSDSSSMVLEYLIQV